MKKIYLSLLILFFIVNRIQAQLTPDVIYGQLFEDVQLQKILNDGKTFVDCIPKKSPSEIVAEYKKLKPKGDKLKQFVLDNFELPAEPNISSIEKTTNIVKHIENLWNILKRKSDKSINGSSLLPLPYSYIVPGGRFREIYYWDSYFTMLGLKESNRFDIIENMIENFNSLILKYGHIPNGNRSYYLSRSQPPYFSLMVQLLADKKGKSIYKNYLPALQKEYDYWMRGAQNLKNNQQYKSVVKLSNGYILNRYWDDLDIPRQESYAEDFETSEKAANEKMSVIRFKDESSMKSFRNAVMKQVCKDLRAAACSGWDFSSRWFYNDNEISTIHTTDFAAVDLNCLLYHLENILANNGGKVDKNIMNNRRKAIFELFWNKEKNFFCDFDIKEQKVSNKITAIGGIVLFMFNANSESEKDKYKKFTTTLKNELLKDGGIVSTTVQNGQQWDAPNGWAPCQWINIVGLEKNGFKDMAIDIAKRWTSLNKKVFEQTGKLTEKYNVVDTSLEGGGGEYPNQDGFGWTNGVYLALIKRFKL